MTPRSVAHAIVEEIFRGPGPMTFDDAIAVAERYVEVAMAETRTHACAEVVTILRERSAAAWKELEPGLRAFTAGCLDSIAERVEDLASVTP